jgi:uncharacterized membrane protein
MTVNLPRIRISKLNPGGWLSSQSFNFSRLQAGLFGLWILSMIALPIAKYLWGENALTWGVALGVTLQSSLVLVLLYQSWGLVRTVQTAAIITIFAWLVEAIGTATGLLFGDYHYTNVLQPQIADVPLLIPLAWLMMLPSAWVISYRIVGRWSGPLFVGVSALAMTAWDLFLDPQMVAWGFWVWAEPSGYFGIPWHNFLGWLLTAALMTVAVRPKNLPTPPFFLIYVVTWLLETIGLLVFWGLSGPALVGFVGMGSLTWLAWSAGPRSN